ncbi:hypothetical protein INT45_007580 [Circinella minor]|uniref:F-box domain-containing protein n=1 Tax=Circinella minor TaxID=1195481 RepID=A0A8H7VPE7_9FUNG|nr:hypothetical protein INT45_007580 [Circinella minor]
MVAISPKPTTLYFEKVLAICHHLKGFWCDSSVILFPRRSQIAATTVPSKLKQLVLNVNPVHDSDIDRMAQLCPNIRRLYINVNSHTAIDRILQHYENELEYLNINMYLCLVTTPSSSIWSPFDNEYNHNCTRQQPLLYSNNQSTIRGLRYLALRKFNETTLISLLHRHAQTLEELYLYYNNNNETLSVQEFQNTNNTNMLFSNLRVLNVSSSNDPTFILNTLLTHVSRTTLQSLHIGSCNLSNHPMILTSIKELENLKYLHLNHSICANREDVIQLLRHFVTKSRQYHDSFSTCEQQPSLKSLLISGTYFQLINDKVLQEIGKIETLERIIIHDATKVTEQGLTSFCHMLKKYNNGYLRFLELNHVPVATFKTLEHLLLIPTLKTLILRNVANDHIKKEDFVGFFERGINVFIYYL